MKAKNYLLQIRKLDTLIQNKIIEREQLYNMALSITARYNTDKVQTSGSQQRMADNVVNLVDLDVGIEECINNLAKAKKSIISTIERLPGDLYDILHKRYVQNMDLGEIAEAKDRSYSCIATLHGKALLMVQEIIDKEEKEKEEGEEGQNET